MSTKSFEDAEDILLIKQIEDDLILAFETEMSDPKQLIVTNKDEILNEFKKYVDFWQKKRPVITMEMHPGKNKTHRELYYKSHICDVKIVGVMKQLRKIGLEQEFIKKYFKN